MNPKILATAILIYVIASNYVRDRGPDALALQELPIDQLVDIAMNLSCDRRVVERQLGERGTRILVEALTQWAIAVREGQPDARGLDNMLCAFSDEFCA